MWPLVNPSLLLLAPASHRMKKEKKEMLRQNDPDQRNKKIVSKSRLGSGRVTRNVGWDKAREFVNRR